MESQDPLPPPGEVKAEVQAEEQPTETRETKEPQPSEQKSRDYDPKNLKPAKAMRELLPSRQK